MVDNFLFEDMRRYIGQTVTIFTESGGLSGSGFTGVLAHVGECTVKLISRIGAAPACPVGSTCGGEVFTAYGAGYANNTRANGRRNGGGGGCYGGCDCCCSGGCYGGGGNEVTPYYNWLGAVTEIPICKIVSFTRNAI